jgi:hypothetical protein
MRLCLLQCILCLLAAGAGAQELEVREVPLPIDTLLASDAVVARVGPTVVTAGEFFLTSLFGPAFVKRQPDTRRRTLQYMINEKLLALGARGDDPRVQSNLAALEGDLATEELYRDDVLKKVRVTEREIDEGVRQQRTTVALRWLFRKGKSDAAALARLLRSGASFDSLFRNELADGTAGADDRSMSSTLFKLRVRNAPMAALAEKLPAGRPSDPVEGPDGYYILQLDSASCEVLTTESADAQARSDVRRALTKVKADSLSDLYVRGLMLGADPVIQRPVFDLLRAYLGWRFLKPERFASFGLTENVADSGYRAIDRYGARTLVRLRAGKISLAEFLQWFRLREVNMGFRQNSPRAFFLSVEDVVWRMVRDRLLVRRALTRGLQHRPGVVAQKRWWKENLLYQVAKDSIKRTITWTDSTLRAYYDEHARSFRDTTGAPRPFSEARDDVLREWYDLELKARLLRTINRRMKDYPVTVNDDVLRTIPVDAENDPRAIEIYTVKKGGTFPHPAFPTIDYDWQTWQ